MGTKQMSEKVANVIIPIYAASSNCYSGFTVAWYEGGKRCRKFFAKESEARSHARLVATKIENQERSALSLKPDDARIYAAALSDLKPLGLALDSAVREIVAARKIVGDY